MRWAFEVSVHQSRAWKIAFTNPTAGPWKRVLGLGKDGRAGEVHRFEIDEKRPDLILFSDTFKTVLIIEAKTDFSGLADRTQIRKTTALFERLVPLLQSYKSNQYWGERADYHYQLGLLWGKQAETKEEVTKTAQLFLEELGAEAKDLICIQGEFLEDRLTHKTYWAISGKEVSLDSYQS